MPKITKVSRLADVPGIGVDLIGNAADAAHDPDILRLENLDTDIRPPKIAIEATKKSLEEDVNNSYLPFLGQNRIRIAATKRVHPSYDWRSESIITAGGLSGILNCFLALLEPGDEVIVTDPTYAGIINRIRIAGGIPKFIPLIPQPDGWRLDINAIEQAISPKTRIFCISPGMPHGYVPNRSEWEAINRAVINSDAWLLYDAAMERIIYDNCPIYQPTSFPGMLERTITVGSASKELRMIGWRIGWVVGPKQVMGDIGLVSISNVVCQTGIAMEGAAAALNCRDDGLKEAIKIWEERRNILLKELSGIPIIKPHGGWSMLLDATHFKMDATTLSRRLLHEAKIATTPMIGWGPDAEKYIRLVFSNEPKERLVGIRRKIDKIIEG